MTNEPSPDYRPIDCGIYSRLEVAILHHTPIACAWRDERGAHHEATLLPRDLCTRDRAEYLIAGGPDGQIEIRLDRVDRWHIGGEEIDPDRCDR